MSDANNSLLKTMEEITGRGHVGAIFVRSGANFLVNKAALDDANPGIWVCDGSHGNPITIRSDDVLAIVEHMAVPG